MLVGFAWGTHLLLFLEASQNTVSVCGSFISLTGGEREPALSLRGGCPESCMYSKLNMFWHSPSQTGRNSLPCIAPVVPRCLVLPAAAAGDRKGAVVTDGRPGDPVMSRGTQMNSLALAVRAQITLQSAVISLPLSVPVVSWTPVVWPWLLSLLLPGPQLPLVAVSHGPACLSDGSSALRPSWPQTSSGGSKLISKSLNSSYLFKAEEIQKILPPSFLCRPFPYFPAPWCLRILLGRVCVFQTVLLMLWKILSLNTLFMH